MAPLMEEKATNKAPNLLLYGTKVIVFVFIKPYCKRHMNKSEGAKNVAPPQKKTA